VTFNDHEGSTKSYMYTREHEREVINASFVPRKAEISADYKEGAVTSVTLHDGSRVQLRKVDEDYDPTDRDAVFGYVRERQGAGEVLTGLLYIDPTSRDMHGMNKTVKTPLVDVPFDELCPGADALGALMEGFR
jgi:2-oxoglutarate ferredoxin oxidoreductase subunit beta